MKICLMNKCAWKKRNDCNEISRNKLFENLLYDNKRTRRFLSPIVWRIIVARRLSSSRDPPTFILKLKEFCERRLEKSLPCKTICQCLFAKLQRRKCLFFMRKKQDLLNLLVRIAHPTDRSDVGGNAIGEYVLDTRRFCRWMLLEQRQRLFRCNEVGSVREWTE